ncbi:MAG: hypothetical protein ACI92Z_003200 [Paracoccaceae bacterium]|jgi:hypothetical protein
MFDHSRFIKSPAIEAFTSRFGRPKQPRVAPQKVQSQSVSLEKFLSIPVCGGSFESSAQRYGQFLARQDRWEDLSTAVHQADQNRETTSGGMPVADLLTYGARADVVRSVEHALMDGKTANDRCLLDGINGLEAVRREHPNDSAIAMILALAHIDIGWAWRGRGWEATVAHQNRKKIAAHLDRATIILAPYCGIQLNSPALVSAKCALLAGQNNPHLHVADEYEALIDLHPENHRHMRAMGHHLLPRWFGSYDQLELEARRTAARTQDIWGNGAYTWVYFDAIAMDERACERVDVAFFVDGLHDIVAARPEQEFINLLTAYCAIALRRGAGISEEADFPRMQISDCADWLIRDHLTEVHPLIWAHAAEGFDNNARITSLKRFAARGRADALHAIANQFRKEINNGQHVTFTPDGPELHPA